MKIAVIGIGHVGLVTGLVFASQGHDVVCLEKNDNIREDLSRGSSHIHEPGIPLLLKEVQKDQSIVFVPSEASALVNAELIFICINTPIGHDGIDFSQLRETLDITGQAIAGSNQFVTVVIKSTVIPGTTQGFARQALEEVSGKACGKDFGIAANPEFLREGKSIEDFLHADRIVIGTEVEESRKALLRIYEPWNCELILVNSSTAEFIKYYSNIFLSLLISFSNEMANIAATDESINYRDVLKGITSDKRLSPILEDLSRIRPEVLSYLVPGPGFGGSCLPKDLEAFTYYAQKRGVDSHILNAALQTNKKQPSSILSLLKKHVGELSSKRILILGLTHKPDTDDIRESASISMVNLLLDDGAELILHDPVASKKVKEIFKEKRSITIIENWKTVLHHIDAVVLMTAWKEYRQLADPFILKELKGKYLLDTRYLFEPAELEGINYISY